MWRLLLPAVLFLVLGGCSSSNGLRSDYRMADLAWMAGSWQSIESDDAAVTISEEHWTDGSGGMMFGVNRLIADDQTVFFEFLRIESDDDNERWYIAQPRGRSPGTRFRLTELNNQRAVFENPEHDFPQRIIYHRRGDELHARIEGEQDGEVRGQEWAWQRMDDDDDD